MTLHLSIQKSTPERLTPCRSSLEMIAVPGLKRYGGRARAIRIDVPYATGLPGYEACRRPSVRGAMQTERGADMGTESALQGGGACNRLSHDKTRQKRIAEGRGERKQSTINATLFFTSPNTFNDFTNVDE